jgi:hypothetical protein
MPPLRLAVGFDPRILGVETDALASLLVGADARAPDDAHPAQPGVWRRAAPSTPAQQLAWERWRACDDFATIRFAAIR